MKMNDNFMRHFRWLTPLLLAFSIYMLQQIYLDFKDFKKDMEIQMEAQKIDMAVVKVILAKKPDRQKQE